MKKVYLFLLLFINGFIGFSQNIPLSTVKKLGCAKYEVKYKSSKSWTYCDCRTGQRKIGNYGGGNATGTLIQEVVAVKTSISGATASFISNVTLRSSSEPANTQLDDNVFDNYKVYPNPATNFINFESNSEIEAAKVEIFNYLGQKVFENEVIDNRVENINLINGIYTLKMFDVNNFEFHNQMISINN